MQVTYMDTAALLDRMIEPVSDCFTPEVARKFLRLNPPESGFGNERATAANTAGFRKQELHSPSSTLDDHERLELRVELLERGLLV